MSKQITLMAERLSMDAAELDAVVVNTLMPRGAQPAHITTFLAVANEYELNPMTKEIYAFPTKGGGIQPIVGIDGWLKIINRHPQFDGMEYRDTLHDGNLIAVTCRIYRKDRSHPVEVTEYMNECRRNSEPWQKWPARMLRHKATIQAARAAFSLAGIIDDDEAERYKEAGAIVESSPVKEAMAAKETAQSVSEEVIEGEIVEEGFASPKAEQAYTVAFNAVKEGKRTVDKAINWLTASYEYSEGQLDAIRQLGKEVA